MCHFGSTLFLVDSTNWTRQKVIAAPVVVIGLKACIAYPGDQTKAPINSNEKPSSERYIGHRDFHNTKTTKPAIPAMNTVISGEPNAGP